jgi:hypothetical protein
MNAPVMPAMDAARFHKVHENFTPDDVHSPGVKN